MRLTDNTKADKMEQDLDKKIIIDKKQKEVEVMTEKFKVARKYCLMQRRSCRKRRERI